MINEEKPILIFPINVCNTSSVDLARTKFECTGFILFALNSQILLKVSVIPILLTLIYLVAYNLFASKQPTQLIVQLFIVEHNCHTNVSCT